MNNYQPRAQHPRRTAVKPSARRVSPRHTTGPGTPGEGLRAGEAIRLARADVDLDAALITVLDSKFGKSRLVPLHPDTTGMLRRYAARRDQLCPAPAPRAFFISAKGTPLLTGNIDAAFARLSAIAGIAGPPGHARPRVHDLRHTMAVRALLEW